MCDTTNRPVIFLAFANDRDDTVGYLRNLPEEKRRLREALEAGQHHGLCELVVRSNCTASDIFNVFQDPRYRNRIAIFHYGGHANGCQLLLESREGKAAAADAGGLAAFLAEQHGLQLVFLNGCSTQQQTQGLLNANIQAVIATSRAIDDQVATEFSVRFYHALARGASLRTAYNQANAALLTTAGGDLRTLYLGDVDKPEDHHSEQGCPWNLYLGEGSNTADQWDLPELVNDPLFGLPPLPKQDLPDSPYRYLRWFTHKDADVFFGRGHQIRELYDRLMAPHTAPVMLFYGASGVGKSSILDAGLIPRLERDNEVSYLRRSEGGLLDALRFALLGEASDVPLETAWLAKEEQTGRPLIVFLDQVEELYTRPLPGLPDELDQLLRIVNATFRDPNRRPQGKLVLGFRKEWLAELETQLTGYELSRTKVFLETLDRNGIIEVVNGPTRSQRLRGHYGLTIEDGLAETIADDLLEDPDSPIAPTLQILLTKMWMSAKASNFERPHYSKDLYRALKREGTLLDDFLDQQIEVFRQRHPDVVDSGLLLDILALHTTSHGTSAPCTHENAQRLYSHVGDKLPAVLQHCLDLYLLAMESNAQLHSTNTTRLAHDTLAPIVRSRFEASQRPGQVARRILTAHVTDMASHRKSRDPDQRKLDQVEQETSGLRRQAEDEEELVAPKIRALDERNLALVEKGASGMRRRSEDEEKIVAASRKKYIRRYGWPLLLIFFSTTLPGAYPAESPEGRIGLALPELAILLAACAVAGLGTVLLWKRLRASTTERCVLGIVILLIGVGALFDARYLLAYGMPGDPSAIPAFLLSGVLGLISVVFITRSHWCEPRPRITFVSYALAVAFFVALVSGSFHGVSRTDSIMSAVRDAQIELDNHAVGEIEVSWNFQLGDAQRIQIRPLSGEGLSLEKTKEIVQPFLKELGAESFLYTGFEYPRLVGRIEIGDEAERSRIVKQITDVAHEAIRAESEMAGIAPYFGIVPVLICTGVDASSPLRPTDRDTLKSLAEKLEAELSQGIQPKNDLDFYVLPMKAFREGVNRLNQSRKLPLDSVFERSFPRLVRAPESQILPLSAR